MLLVYVHTIKNNLFHNLLECLVLGEGYLQSQQKFGRHEF